MDVPLLEISNLAVSLALVVLIWIVQLVHYPSFSFYAPQDFPRGMAHHQQQITRIVAPLMLTEVALLVPLVLRDPSYLVLAGIVGAIWISTAAVQVPLHQRLTVAKEEALIQRLVRTNWVRTILWSAKLITGATIFLSNHLTGELT